MNTLILLHGAIASASQMEPLAAILRKDFDVHLTDFPGHGGTGNTGSFSITHFADHLKKYCSEKGISDAHVFGYSMGGYVALYLAAQEAALIRSITTLATKFEWNEGITAREVKMLQPEVIEEKLPKFAATLKERHAPNNWKEVLQNTASMLIEMGRSNPLNNNSFEKIMIPVRLMLGDRDKMVGLEETVSVYQKLANGQLAILPGTAHPIEGVDIDLLASMIRKFIQQQG